MSAVAVHRRIDGPADAPTIVLSNSLGASLGMWEPQVDALAREFRVVRYDMRGHGRSPVPPAPYSLDDLADDLLGLLDDLGIASAHLAGLSLGGLVGLEAAARASDRVRSVTVLSGAARFPNPERYRERAALVRVEGMGAVAEGVVARWLTPSYAADHPETVAWLRSMVEATPAEGYAACCEVVAEADVTPGLGSIRAPVLCVAAAEDPALPVDDVERLARLIPSARFTVVAAAAHLQNVEQPGLVASLIAGHASGRGLDERQVRAQGTRVRRAVLGNAHVDAATARTTVFDAPFQELVTTMAWGGVWSRPGLDRRTRSSITLAALVALGAEGEIALHVRGALRNGLTPAEIAEILLHVAAYAGIPRANTAFAIARRVLEEDGLL